MLVPNHCHSVAQAHAPWSFLSSSHIIARASPFVFAARSANNTVVALIFSVSVTFTCYCGLAVSFTQRLRSSVAAPWRYSLCFPIKRDIASAFLSRRESHRKVRCIPSYEPSRGKSYKFAIETQRFGCYSLTLEKISCVRMDVFPPENVQQFVLSSFRVVRGSARDATKAITNPVSGFPNHCLFYRHVFLLGTSKYDPSQALCDCPISSLCLERRCWQTWMSLSVGHAMKSPT